jgi:hypothetical protein
MSVHSKITVQTLSPGSKTLSRFVGSLLLYSKTLPRFVGSLLPYSKTMPRFVGSLLLYSKTMPRFVGSLLLSYEPQFLRYMQDYRDAAKRSPVNLNNNFN